MSQTVFARQNEVLDQVLWRVFRRTAGVLEQALALNPGLAQQVFLPEGHPVRLPDRPAAPARQLINLWS